MKKIYVAGPYSADNVMDVLHNIRRGIETATLLLNYGFAPFCPWLDFHFVLMDPGRNLTIQKFYDYSMAWLEVSDAMLVIGEWKSSTGTLHEINFARIKGIPIYFKISELLNNER